MSKAEKTKIKIVSAAHKLIKLQGFEATHIKQICEEAGVAYRTFYMYFPSKESVITTLFFQIDLFNPEAFSGLLIADGTWNKLWKAYSMLIDKTIEIGPEICARIFICLLGNPETRAYAKPIKHVDILEPLIKHAQEQGEILIKGDHQQICRSSMDFVCGVYFRWAMKLEDFDLHMELRKNLENYFQVRDDLRKTKN